MRITKKEVKKNYIALIVIVEAFMFFVAVDAVGFANVL